MEVSMTTILAGMSKMPAVSPEASGELQGQCGNRIYIGNLPDQAVVGQLGQARAIGEHQQIGGAGPHYCVWRVYDAENDPTSRKTEVACVLLLIATVLVAKLAKGKDKYWALLTGVAWAGTFGGAMRSPNERFGKLRWVHVESQQEVLNRRDERGRMIRIRTMAEAFRPQP
jgi:hypothetical protein